VWRLALPKIQDRPERIVFVRKVTGEPNPPNGSEPARISYGANRVCGREEFFALPGLPFQRDLAVPRVPFASTDHCPQLQHRIPIASCAWAAQVLFDQFSSQFGLSDSGRIINIRLLAVGLHDLWPNNSGPK
jgi:hypothetical protein